MQPVSIGNGYDAVVLDGNMVLPAGKKGAYDFYIRDYQQNVRMIVTEETHSGNNICTMEMARAGAENPVFGQTGSANEVVTTRFDATQIPGTWPGNTAGSVSILYKTGHAIGPNSLLKVMAGDNITATTQYYYQGSATNNSANSLATDVITNLLSVINGSSVTSAVTKGSATAIGNNLKATLPFVNTTDPDKATTDNLPRAYLSVVFFDERFNFVAEHSSVIRVSSNNNSSLTIPNVQAPKNGYAYIYLSNESDVPVYFDNFNVVFNRGRLIEENHYYAYGLKIAGISSKKLGDPNEGTLDNKNLYNDKELFDDGDLNWYDYGFRNYDPQIGRFTQLDPLTWEYPELTSYQYAGNEPITNVDLDGLEPLGSVASGFVEGGHRALGEVVVQGVRHIAPTAAKVGLSAANLVSIATNLIKISGDIINYQTKQGVQHLGAFTLGVANAWTSDQLLGVGRTDAQANSLTDSKGVAYQIGHNTGDILSILSGASEITLGGVGELVSFGTASPVAIPIALHGSTAIGMGLYHLAHGNIVYSTSSETSENNLSPDNSSGTQLNSKTLWKGEGKERIDVENPNPSQRPGQIHYQDNAGNKFLFDPKIGKFKNAPNKVNNLLKNEKFKSAIEKGLKYLGLKH